MAGASRKPDSVTTGEGGGGYLSDFPPKRKDVRPTRLETDSLIEGLFGLAPDGVYRAPNVTIRPVSSYLAVSPLPRE